MPGVYWRPDKRPRTRRSAECGYAPSLFPPSARCSGGTCGSAGRQGGFQSGTALPPCRSAGRQSRLPSGLSPGRRRRPHHRGKVAGTRVANAGMGDRRGREHPWRAPLYPVCAPSSPSGCGCKPDRQAMINQQRSEGATRDKFLHPPLPPKVILSVVAGLEAGFIAVTWFCAAVPCSRGLKPSTDRRRAL